MSTRYCAANDLLQAAAGDTPAAQLVRLRVRVGILEAELRQEQARSGRLADLLAERDRQIEEYDRELAVAEMAVERRTIR